MVLLTTLLLQHQLLGPPPSATCEKKQLKTEDAVGLEWEVG